MTAFCFQNNAKFTFGQAFTFRANIMKLAAIFEAVENINDFQTIDYFGHLIYQSDTKVF